MENRIWYYKNVKYQQSKTKQIDGKLFLSFSIVIIFYTVYAIYFASLIFRESGL